MTADQAIKHALEQCAIYGEYEFAYPDRYGVGLRVVIYPTGLQAWHVASEPFEWLPTSADHVLWLLNHLDLRARGQVA